MNSRYLRRLIRRFTYGLARPVLWAAAVGAAFFGVLMGWILFAEPHKLGSGDFGNVAEWLAAIGTVVVGFGAWRYAREGHLQRVQETARALRRESNISRAILSAALMRAVAVKGLPVLYNPSGDDPIATWTNGLLKSRVRTVRRVMDSIVWPELERVPVGRDIVRRLAIVDLRLMQTREQLDYAEECVAGLKPNVVMDEDARSWAEGIKQTLGYARDESDLLIGLLNEAIQAA